MQYATLGEYLFPSLHIFQNRSCGLDIKVIAFHPPFILSSSPAHRFLLSVLFPSLIARCSSLIAFLFHTRFAKAAKPQSRKNEPFFSLVAHHSLLIAFSVLCVRSFPCSPFSAYCSLFSHSLLVAHCSLLFFTRPSPDPTISA